MIPGVRPYRAADRQEALEHIPSNILNSREVIVADAGPHAGYLTWLDAANGSLPVLCDIWTPDHRQLFYRLIALAAVQAIDRGYKRAWFPIVDRKVLALIERDFDVTVEVEAIDTETGKPSRWRIEVGLADALEQLQAVI